MIFDFCKRTREFEIEKNIYEKYKKDKFKLNFRFQNQF
jgi:hypothetical protein